MKTGFDLPAKIILAWVIQMFLISQSQAVNLPPMESYVHGSVDQRVLSSSYAKQNYRLSIYLPAEYKTSNKRYPVVYLPDASVTFGIANNLADLLILGKEIPPVIIVGVDSGAVLLGEFLDNRYRDYTPTKSDQFPTSGEAEKYEAFLTSELIPYIDSNYRTDRSDRVLATYALSGVMGTHLLFKEDQPFNRYLLSQPKLWWDKGVIFDTEKQYAANHQSLPVKLYTAVGTADDQRYISAWEEFVAVMGTRNYQGLEKHTAVFEGETHFTVFSRAFTAGLKYLFAE